MKTILFSYAFPGACSRVKCINLSGKQPSAVLTKNSEFELIDLSTLFDCFGSEWFEQFSIWLAQLNSHHAGLFWWAHTATAKNLLSSSLSQQYFQVRAICEIAKQEKFNVLNIVGATPGQMATIASFLPASNFQFRGRAWKLRYWHNLLNNLKSFTKQWLHFASVLVGFFRYRCSKLHDSPDLCLFTYIDGARRVGVDNYFGRLPDLLRKTNKPFSAFYLGLLSRPYWKRLKHISKESSHTPYMALYGLLHTSDYFWALLRSFQAWWLNAYSKKNTDWQSEAYSPILREVFVNEIGGYFHNLLVYKAFCRFVKNYKPKVIVYPFENKSLEKMMLLAVRYIQPNIKMVGYQHTSVTPKHSSTLLLREGEAQYTPLPDKIITVGKITKDYFEAFGNYPSGILITGGALRQTWRERLPRQSMETICVLLALSSSKDELIQSVEFFKKVMQILPDLELGIRPHINFPISILSRELSQWITENALDFSNTLLEDNLNWCSLTAYVSSTVALETLMRGKPVVKFPISEVVSSDPLIGEVPFRWRADNHLDMVDVLMQVNNMSASEYDEGSLCAVRYVRDYLSPMNEAVIKTFSDVLLSQGLATDA